MEKSGGGDDNDSYTIVSQLFMGKCFHFKSVEYIQSQGVYKL